MAVPAVDRDPPSRRPMRRRPAVAPRRAGAAGIVLAGVLAGALSACGGGGGGGGEEPPSGGNTAPTIEGQPSRSVQAGSAYRFTPRARDADGDTLRFSATGLPPWATLDPDSGRIEGTPGVDDLGGSGPVTLSVSDGRRSVSLPAFTLSVTAPAIRESDIQVSGRSTPTTPTSGGATAYQVVGALALSPCRFTTQMVNADLHTEYDETGNLADLYGLTDLPGSLSDVLHAGPNVRANIGYYTGRQINANPDLGIRLQPDTGYFVYAITTEVTVEAGDRQNPGRYNTVTLTLPAGGQTIFITDPCDVMVYRYNGSPAGDAGYGESDHGLIPFVPNQDWAELDTFDGHTIEKGSFGLGIKVFDVLTITGTRVTRNPDFGSIDWTDPLAAQLQYTSGLNGVADFDLGVAGVGLFSFHAADASATLDVGTTRAHMAMQATIEPDVSWQPPWFPIVPRTQIRGRWVVDADGTFNAQLTGDFRSTLPEAHLTGEMALDSRSARFTAAIDDDELPLSIEATFRDLTTTVQVNTPKVDLDAGISEAVLAAVDRQLEAGRQAWDDLQQATADYEFELSLRGLRSALPTVADTAIATLNGVPGQVHTAVYQAVRDYIDDYETCTTVPIPYPPWTTPVCSHPLDDLLTESQEDARASSAAAAAQTQAAAQIASAVAAMQDLKAQALAGDDEALRLALKTALDTAYSLRSVTVDVTVTVDLGLFDKNFSHRTTATVLPADTAAQIQTAAANVHRIQETSDLKISAQAVYDAIPVDSALNRVRDEVEQGLAQIPSFDGGGYVLTPTTYEPYIILSGQKHGVQFNLLDPAEALKGIADTIVGLLAK